jgi:cyclase
MLALRIIPCLDVKDGQVVKGVRFQNHRIVGGIEELAWHYDQQGADELVLYDISASSEKRVVDVAWVEKLALKINIPFCVAGGIRSLDDAKRILNAGADKISINSPALENPGLIDAIAAQFGAQCVVVGVDSQRPLIEGVSGGGHEVYKYTGNPDLTVSGAKTTLAWVKEAESRGAGEIVLNCMAVDGVKRGYEIDHLREVAASVKIPVIASGGAGQREDFLALFQQTACRGALAASVFHDGKIAIPELKQYLRAAGIGVRK